LVFLSLDTLHVLVWLKSVLYAEVLATGKSMSVLTREWLEERLDLEALP
jgi:hypothetical protein